MLNRNGFSNLPVSVVRQAKPLVVLGLLALLLLFVLQVSRATPSAPTGKSTLGDFVWLDTDGDGQKDAGEQGINGVVVRLYLDADNDQQPDPTEELTSTLTINDPGNSPETISKDGYYDFSADGGTAQIPNVYIVEIDDSNCAPGGPLHGYVYVGPNGFEPCEDARLIVPLVGLIVDYNDADFPFYRPNMVLGNQVWYDTNDNGLIDSGEQGVEGVTMELYRDSDGSGGFSASDVRVETATTDANGFYLFSNLDQSLTVTETYMVVLPASNFAGAGLLAGYQNSTGSADPDTDTDDHDDNGIPYAAGGAQAPHLSAGGFVASLPISLTLGNEPGQTTNPGDTNLTVDFGFYTQHLSGQVWRDIDGDGQLDANEQGINGVPVELLDGANIVVGTTTTTAGGFYTFAGLISGTYTVRITAPAGANSSPVDSSSPLAADDDDDGKGSGSGQIVSEPFVLSPGTTTNGNIIDNTRGSTTNSRVDFGLVAALVNLGNRIWFDQDNSGTLTNSEQGIDGVTVELYYDSNGDGSYTPSVDQFVDRQTTDVSGFYTFTNLAETTSQTNTYIVVIPTGNFAAGGRLVGHASSGGSAAAPDPDDNVDSDDNGRPYNANGTVATTPHTPIGGYVASLPLSLVMGAEPSTTVVNGDSNFAVDFGFIPPVASIAIQKRAGSAPEGVPLVIGQMSTVTYTYVITNTSSGLTATYLSAITILDDSGTPGNPADDRFINSLQCPELAGPLAPGAFVTCVVTMPAINSNVTNIAQTTGNPTDSRGSDIPRLADPTDSDDAAVLRYTPRVALTKRLNSDEPLRTGDPLSFTISITNTGNITIVTLPVVDVFAPTYIEFVSASPAQSSINGSRLRWDDLTVTAGDLAPGQVTQIIVNFKALVDTTNAPVDAPCTVAGHTCNHALTDGPVADSDDIGPRNSISVPDDDGFADANIVNPAAINLVDFTYELAADGVHLDWTTVTEVDMLGFHIWRQSDQATAKRINEELIVAQYSGQPNSATYKFVDSTALREASMTLYMLEILTFDGRSERYLFSLRSAGTIFLPIVQRS